jgi:tRNA(Ile)-lysidine synthase
MGSESQKTYKAVLFDSDPGFPQGASQMVVAYSGGLDSTVLLHMAKQLKSKTPLLAVHVNHNLSDNALNWQTHCRQICDDWHIPFIAKSVHITSNEKGLEAEARKLRYAAIAEVIEVKALVLTGQHQQDQLETFLIQLKRGAGPKGLSCMPRSAVFEKQSTLVRPLLDMTRDDLEQYAQEHNLTWIEDESNQDTRFDRNFIRHQILPTLQQRWPGFGKAASRSVGLIAEQQQLVDELAAQDLKTLRLIQDTHKLDEDAHKLIQDTLNLDGLLKLSDVRQRNVLRYWITTRQVTLPSKIILDKMIEEVIKAKPDAQPKVQWSGHQLRRFRDEIYLFDNSIEQKGEDCTLTLNDPMVLNDNIGLLCLSDEDGSQGLVIRSPRLDEVVTVRFDVTGISCKPSGSPHTRKLKKLFKDYDVPPWQRSRTPLVYYNEQLVAVAGLFVCDGWSMGEIKICFDAVHNGSI